LPASALVAVAAPVQRPSLYGAGEFPESIELRGSGQAMSRSSKHGWRGVSLASLAGVNPRQ